ncbi:MAG: hypothetical protein GQ531_01230 [Sulfurovum sp.]|nr:hypothetical protein [Sulfurovum sp.]
MDHIELARQRGEGSKVSELVYLLDTEKFNAFIKSIKESPEDATLRGMTLGTQEGDVLIIKAINWGCLECVKVLVDNGANVNADSGLGMRESIFLMALKLHKYDIALYLLNNGADPKNGDYSWHLRTYSISTEADYDAVIDKLRAGTL